MMSNSFAEQCLNSDVGNPDRILRCQCEQQVVPVVGLLPRVCGAQFGDGPEKTDRVVMQRVKLFVVLMKPKADDIESSLGGVLIAVERTIYQNRNHAAEIELRRATRPDSRPKDS